MGDISFRLGDVRVDFTQHIRVSVSSRPLVLVIVEYFEAFTLRGVLEGVDISDVQRLTHMCVRGCLKK